MKKFILSLTSLIVILGSITLHIIGNKDDKVLQSNKTNITISSTIPKDNLSYTSSNENLSSAYSENKIKKTLNCIGEGKDKDKINQIFKIEVNNLTSDNLYLRTGNKLKSDKLTSKDCNILAYKSEVV